MHPPTAGVATEELDLDLDYGDELMRAVLAVLHSPRLPEPGERVGGRDGRRFEILKELGEGAMGRVFRARDEELLRVVALKFLLSPEGRGEPSLLPLLRREARAIAQLDHENIVRIFDVDEWSGAPSEPPTPFLIMECLEGESLAALLRRQQRLGLQQALSILSEILAGLAHAHEHHVIHRDLKPSNVFLTQRGKVKLLDFGLAWLMVGSDPSMPHLPTAGTPAYMAPEQWRGEAQDARTDVWAAGVILYEMLTGMLPSASDDLRELRVQVLSPEPLPSVRMRSPELPWELEHLLATALAKEPARRFQTAQELRDELHELIERFGYREEPRRLLAPERRQVTLMSCQLVSPEGCSEKLDAEELGEFQEAFHQCCAEAIQRAGGSVALALGHEVLACFGYPVAREEDSEHAVRTGLDLLRTLPGELQRRLPHLPPDACAPRVGIHTDSVTLVESPQQALGRALSIQGEAPRVATWLAELAGPGSAIVSDATWALVRKCFEAEPLGARAYHGLLGTLRLGTHRVLRERSAAVRFARALAAGGLTPLVGREPELEQLLAAWAEARDGRGAFVLVTGEAGIGKSRLIQELRQRVSHEPLFTFECQCWAQSSTSALHPVSELLLRLLHGRSCPSPAPSLEARLSALGLSPEDLSLLALLSSQPLPEALPPLKLSPEKHKERTLEALTTLLLHLTRERPVLGVVEDLHWADPSMLELLGHALERIPGARLLLVLSARPEFHPPWPPRPWLRKLELEHLPSELTATLVRQVAGGSALPPELVHQLVERTDGIPLFVEELTRVVVEHGPALAIPATLHELLLARLDLLPTRQRALAQVCAVVGRSFSRALLAALTRRKPAALRRELEELVAAGFLQPHEEDSTPGYRFHHALLQEAAYESLPRSTRRQLHQRAARALVKEFPRVEVDRPELLAYHHTEAGEFPQALHHWAQAGQRASRRSANVEAVSHYRQALRLLSRLPPTPQRTQQELQLLIALGIPLAQVQGYRSPEVESTYSRAHELLQQVGDALPRLELPYWGLFAYHFSRAEYSLAHALAVQLVSTGQRQENRELLALGHRLMAAVLLMWGHLLAAREHVEQALACSEFSLEEHRGQAERYWLNPRAAALSLGAMVYAMLGEPQRSRRYGQDAVRLARRIDHIHTTTAVLAYVTAACQLRREVGCTLSYANETIALSREHGYRGYLMLATFARIWALAELGQAREALALMRQAVASVGLAGIRSGNRESDALRAELYLKLGQPGEALEVATQALQWAETTEEHFFDAELHRLRGEAQRALGHEQQARECFLQALEEARARGARAFEQRAWESLATLPQESPPPA